jgi:plasmid stability protein
MASITIRNLDDGVKKRLRKQAAENGRSLEAEAREILSQSAHGHPLPSIKTGLDMFRGIREVVEKYGGVELEIPPRTPMRPLNLFEGTKEFRRESAVKRRTKRRK